MRRQTVVMGGFLWLLGTLCWALDDPLQQPITFDQPAQTIRQLLRTLSEQTGVKLFAPNPIGREIVLVSVRQMPLKELMAHLATVTDGEWVQRPDGCYTLTRTPRVVQQRRQQDNERILEALRRTLQSKEVRELIAPLTRQQVRQRLNELKELMRTVESENPSNLFETNYPSRFYELQRSMTVGYRLTWRLVQQLGLNRLLEIPVGERRVFSNVKGAYLLPLGFSPRPLLEQYLQEIQMVHQVWNSPTEGIPAEHVREFHQRYGLVDGSWLAPMYPTSPLTQVYLIVQRLNPDAFTCSTEVTTSELGVLSIPQQTDIALFALSADEEAAVQGGSERVEWSERSRQFLETFRQLQSSCEPVALPAILDPAQTEPLSLIPTEVVRACAHKRGKSLVALLPDTVMGVATLALNGETALAQFEAHLRHDTEFIETEHVLLLKPRFSSYQWDQRTDRAALSQLLRQILQRGHMQLSDYLILSRMVRDRFRFDSLYASYLELCVPMDELWRLWDGDFQFIQSLTPQQIAALQAGRSLALKDLAPAQRQQLIRDLYSGQSRVDSPRPPADTDTIIIEADTEDDMPFIGFDLIHILYPDGLPAQTTIRLADAQEVPGIFAQCRAGVWGSFLSLRSMAACPPGKELETVQIRTNNAPLACMPGWHRPFIVEVKIGKNHAVYLPVNDLMGDLRFGDDRLIKEAKPIRSVDDLPEAFRKKLAEYRKEQQEMEELFKRYVPDPKP